MIFILFQVAGVAATTEQSSAPSVPQQGSSTLQLTDESHMSIATENAGYVLFYLSWENIMILLNFSKHPYCPVDLYMVIA